MIIRKAVLSDVDNALLLLQEFNKDSLEDLGLGLKNHFIIEKLVPNCLATTLVAIEGNKLVGIISGTIAETFTNGEKVFQEIVWFVSKQYRRCGVLLLKRLEEECRNWGCKAIVMVNIVNSMPAEVGRFYERSGYKLLEQHYIKRI